MSDTLDSYSFDSTIDLDNLVGPDTPEHLWPSYSPIVAPYHVGTFTDTVVPETELEINDPSEMFEYFGGESPFYGPSPPAILFYGPPPPATSVDIPQAPPPSFIQILRGKCLRSWCLGFWI